MQTTPFARRLLAPAPVVVLCGLLASVAPAGAQSGNGPGSVPSDRGRCSNRTLFGDYGSVIEGTILGPGFQIRGLSRAHFDGAGNVTQVDHIVFDGNPPAQEWAPGTGTYNVNPDCTGSAVIVSASQPEPVRLHFVVVDNGKQIIQVVDANAVTAIAWKVR